MTVDIKVNSIICNSVFSLYEVFFLCAEKLFNNPTELH